MTMQLLESVSTTGPGELLRHWRHQRHMTQQELALQCEVSSRHLSFVETGRSVPTASMILKMCEQLEVPLRHRNDILLAAGHAPAYSQTSLDQPSMESVSAALIQILDGHLPFPAVVVDRHWDMVDANAAIDHLTTGCATDLLEPPVNVLRLSLHPRGMAPRIRNLPQWRSHILARLDHQIRVTGDAALQQLRSELAQYPGGVDNTPSDNLVVPLRVATDAGELSFLSTTTMFGTPMDVTLAELAIESFFPANSETAEILRVGS